MKALRICSVALVSSLCLSAAGVYPQTPPGNASNLQLVIDSGGHTAQISSLMFTRDNKYLVSAGRDKVVRVWDLQTGKTARTIRGEIGSGQWGVITAADLTPDNKFLV